MRKLVVAQQVQDFEHRLVDELGVEPVEVRILGRGRPLGGDLLEVLDRHAGVGGADDLLPVLLGEAAMAFWSPERIAS